MKIKTPHQIIDDIVTHYSEDISRRGMDGGCVYWTERKGNIRVCAVGYCLIDPKKLAESDNNEMFFVEMKSDNNQITNQRTDLLNFTRLFK